MIIDSHTHVFARWIIESVLERQELVEHLHLEATAAPERCTAQALVAEARAGGVDRCLVLPVAPAEGVIAANDEVVALAARHPELIAGGTLHPHLDDVGTELDRLHAAGVRTIKLSSFSQRFGLEESRTHAMLDQIAARNRDEGAGFFLVLDTFTLAERYFGAEPATVTTPSRLAALVERFPEIPFVAAHLGGLAAPVATILAELPPRPNLYLDTSNATHLLGQDEVCALLEAHTPRHILFGTDWPWFGHAREVERIRSLLDHAGCREDEIDAVLGGNALRLLGSRSPRTR
jgi:predicted TIM-barrel fold metal-dependent hydrolase